MTSERTRDFEMIFVRHVEAVRRFTHSRLDPQSAEDVTAETFLAAWRDLDRLPPEPLAWLLRVARNKIVDQYRADGRRAGIARDLAEHRAHVDEAVHVDLDAADREWVRAAFAAMAPRDQEVLRLVAWDGLTTADAAHVLGIPPTTFAVRLHRARARLRRHLDATATSDPVEELHDHRT